MKGKVKSYSAESGYGYITTDGYIDLIFHISDVMGGKLPVQGDCVEFQMGDDSRGRRAAKSVAILGSRGWDQATSRQPSRPRGAFVEVTRDVVVEVKYRDADTTSMRRAGGGVVGGAIGGAAGGPVGVVVGAALGALLGGVAATKTVEQTARIEITATCLRCGGTGHVTAETDRFVGFQCGSCNRFWKAFDPQKIRAEALEEAKNTVKREDRIAEEKLWAAAESARRRQSR